MSGVARTNVFEKGLVGYFQSAKLKVINQHASEQLQINEI